jgi:hypothetical protein
MKERALSGRWPAGHSVGGFDRQECTARFSFQVPLKLHAAAARKSQSLSPPDRRGRHNGNQANVVRLEPNGSLESSLNV